MSRSGWLLLGALLLAVAGVGLALSRAATADGAAAHRIVYLHVSGRGPTARAWYQAAPPSGMPVQDALDKLAAEGFHFAAIAAASPPAQFWTGSAGPSLSGDATLDSPFVVVLER